MTLQYRIRSKSDDRKWLERIRLCEIFITQAADSWCLGDAEFPTERVASGILFLFSKRCFPDQINQHHLFEILVDRTGTPADEYILSWPKREFSAANELIQVISSILEESVCVWEDRGFQALTFEAVVKRIVEEILRQQYVVFHHKETTSRDVNHWGI